MGFNSAYKGLKSDFQIYPDVELGVTYDGVVQFARALNAVVRVNHSP